jgi:hypothetical protein
VAGVRFKSAWVIVATSLLSVSDASAEDRALYMPMGVNLGAALYPGLSNADASFLLGAELSLANVDASRDGRPSPWRLWYGGYVDGVADFANVRGRFSIGPEFGFGIFGIDGGPVMQVGGEKVHLGGHIRLFVSFASIVTLYGRQGFVPNAPDVSRYTEMGALFKYPLPL